MLGMKNHFDISGSIEIREVDIAGVACSGKKKLCCGKVLQTKQKLTWNCISALKKNDKPCKTYFLILYEVPIPL